MNIEAKRRAVETRGWSADAEAAFDKLNAAARVRAVSVVFAPKDFRRINAGLPHHILGEPSERVVGECRSENGFWRKILLKLRVL